MPLRKVHELTFLWFGLPGPLLIVLCAALNVYRNFLGNVGVNFWFRDSVLAPSHESHVPMKVDFWSPELPDILHSKEVNALLGVHSGGSNVKGMPT